LRQSLEGLVSCDEVLPVGPMSKLKTREIPSTKGKVNLPLPGFLYLFVSL